MHRKLCLSLLGLILPLPLVAEQPPTAVELLKLEGKEFEQAAEEASYKLYGSDDLGYTTDDLIALADRLVATVPTLRGPRGIGLTNDAFRLIFQEACKKANDRQLDRLIALYARVDSDSFAKRALLAPLAARWIQREVRAIRAEHPRTNLRGPDVPTPPELAKVSKELVSAWQMYRRALSSYDGAISNESSGEKMSADANEKSFYRLIDSALTGQTNDLKAELAKYVDASAGCLNVTDVDDGKNIALLLTLLRERKFNEAVGAALRVSGTTGSTSSLDEITGAIVELFEACSLDWETIFVGGQLDQQKNGWSFGGKYPFLDALSRFGSDRAVDSVIQLAHLAKDEARTPYVAAFNSWIETSPTCGKCDGKVVDFGSHGGERERGALSKTAQLTALRTTEDFATTDCSEQLAYYAVNTFARTQRQSSASALQALTGHYSQSIAEMGAKVLCAMGQPAPSVRSAAVRFKVLVNGQALPAGTSVSWGVYSNGSGTSSSTDVGNDGTVQLERKYFTDIKNPPTNVSLGGSGDTEFSVDLPPPANIDAVTLVNVEASTLEIRLHNKDQLNAPPSEKADLRLLPHKDGAPETRWAPDFHETDEVSANPVIFLRSVQQGSYNIFIRVPGAELWCGVVEVKPGGGSADVSLKPGSDMRVEIVTPNGDRFWRAELLKDGKHVDIEPDYRSHLYRSLPCGKYTLRIPGSELIEKYQKKAKLTRGPDEAAFVGREVSFEIKEGSSALIDLGEIHLARTPD